MFYNRILSSRLLSSPKNPQLSPENVFPAELVAHLRAKQALLKAHDPEHQKIRTLLLILGGGMRGVSGAGVVTALHALGLGDVFDTVVGVSAGAANAAYYLAGEEQVKLGTSIYYQDLPPHFIRYRRRPIVDIDFLEQCWHSGEKRLDTAAVRATRSEFFVAVTRVRDYQGVLLDAKPVPDIVSLLKATSAIPRLYGRSVTIGDEAYFDGSVGMLFPAEIVVERFDPTDLVIITNHQPQVSLGAGRSREQMLTPLFLRSMPADLRAKLLSLPEENHRAIEFLRRQRLTWGLINMPVRNVWALSRNATKLRDCALASAKHTGALFGEPELRVDLP